jgi:hypothetical protein
VLAVLDLVPELTRVRLGVLHLGAVAAGLDDPKSRPSSLALDPGAELDGDEHVAERILQEADQLRTDPRDDDDKHGVPVVGERQDLAVGRGVLDAQPELAVDGGQVGDWPRGRRRRRR